jgi:hypothetical protein
VLPFIQYLVCLAIRGRAPATDRSPGQHAGRPIYNTHDLCISSVISFYRLLMLSKHLFRCFCFDELPPQSRNSIVETLLLIKVIIKEISGVNMY